MILPFCYTRMLLMNTNSMDEKLVYILNEMAEYLQDFQKEKHIEG